MFVLNLSTTDPCFNLAVEECLLKRSSEEYLILYVNNPSVIIGKHQVAHREADTIFTDREKIPVIRRISGGGTVFHDQGNLNFTFIINSSQGKQVDFRKYTAPVIDFLAILGIKVSFESKNDLKVEGLKISGNAEHIYRDRVLHHGTLLYDTDLVTLRASLRKDTSHYSTRAVESNPSQVTNLKTMIPEINGMNDFRIKMLEYFISIAGNSAAEINSGIYDEANSLAKSKFGKWEWNYAYGPEYHYNNIFEADNEKVSVHLFVSDGKIQTCKILGSEIFIRAGIKLVGCRHMPDDVNDIFQKEGIKNIFTRWMF